MTPDIPDLDLPEYVPEVTSPELTEAPDLPEADLGSDEASPAGHWFGWEQLHPSREGPEAPALGAEEYALEEMPVPGPRASQEASEAPEGYESPEYASEALEGLPGDLGASPPPGRWFTWEGLTATDGDGPAPPVTPSSRVSRPGMPDLDGEAAEAPARDGGDQAPGLLRQILAALTQPPPPPPAPTLDVGHSTYSRKD